MPIESIGNPMMWAGFLAFVLAMLALDLGVFHRKSHEVRPREALGWTAFWISLALVFNVGLYFWAGGKVALEFFTGYLIEKALSVDNIFVILVIFSTFAVPAKLQHRVLFWGILGALIMRGALITAGAALLHSFHWLIYIFGGLLLVTGIRLLTHKEEEIDPTKNPIIRLLRRFLPVTDGFRDSHFVVHEDGRRKATPLLMSVVAIEATDLVFAIDSIPAVFGITEDPFVVYTSNIFAILGLRSLYFLLAGAIATLHYLKVGLALVLMFVGLKMLIASFYTVPIVLSLVIIALLLGGAVAASLLRTRRLQQQ